MKKLYTLLASFIITLNLFAQAPEKMSYQAVVRDANNALIMNQAVGMRIQILQGSVSGTTVYEETQTPTSNDNGLVTLEIGTGTIVSGMFGTIDWSTGPYFIKTETDPTGATNYTISGTSQLMSVPYALYAKTSGNGAGPQGPAGADGIDGVVGSQGATGPAGADGINGAVGAQGATGPAGGDGINGQDGAPGIDGAVGPSGASGNGITSTLDNNDGTLTYNYTDGTTFTTSSLTGPTGPTGPAGGPVGPQGPPGTPYVEPTYTIGINTDLGGYIFWVSTDGKHGLVAETQDQGLSTWYNAQNLISDPANHSTNGQKFRDWRLPTKHELNEMYLSRSAIGNFGTKTYWSSFLIGNGSAWRQNFFSGLQFFGTNYLLTYFLFVRSVREF